MTPSLHKGQPVENFLCEDSCVCGHAGETVEVRRYDSRGCLFFCCTPLLTLSLSPIHSVVSCPLFLVVSAYFLVAQPPYKLPPSGLFIPSATPQTKVQLGLNTQCKATMPQLTLAAWDNYSFPLFCRVTCCHWYHDIWERTLMILFSVHSS